MPKAAFRLAGVLVSVAMLAAGGQRAFSGPSGDAEPPEDSRSDDTGSDDTGSDHAGPAADEPRLQINSGGHTASVRALAFTPDSTRLCSASMDKTVQIWNLLAVTRDLKGNYLRERTIRWEVARGLRGSVYALAAAPSDGLLAFGGFGARTETGLIRLVDPVSGELVKVLDGHRQTVCSLAFSQDGNWLVSADTDGRTILWKRGPWKPRILYGPDAQTYTEQTARRIQQQPALRPVAFLGSSHVILPVCVGQESENTPLRWQLQEISVSNPQDFRTFGTMHLGMVTALAVSPDGEQLASAGLGKRLYLWRLGEQVGAEPLRCNWGDSRDDLDGVDLSVPTVVSLGFSPDGKTLVAGTAAVGDPPRSQLQIWDVDTRTIKGRRQLADQVHACAISPDGTRLAYVGGDQNQVFSERLGGASERLGVSEQVGASERRVELRGKGRRVMDVAFALEKPFYRIAFGYDADKRRFNQQGTLERTFDPERRELGPRDTLDPADWIAPDLWRGEWTVRRLSDGTLQLSRGGEPKGKISFDQLNLPEGDATCACWIPDDQGKPVAIAVGARRQNGIYVFRLVEEGVCPVLRYFRGHNDLVTSIGISRDLRYLVSGSADNTVKIWSLSDYQQGRAAEGRWGATFRVLSEEELRARTERDLVRRRFAGGQLVVGTINEAGPLYRKGVRAGDVITNILWQDDPVNRRPQRADQAASILANLGKIPWGTQVEFRSARNGSARPGFQLVPAWQPLASLFVGAGSEWAFWTPEGYYDASINGYTLFGWLVNRGRDVTPDFYRADQFYAKLEQPAVIERLLEAGSLPEALRRAKVKSETEPEEALSTLIGWMPSVKILLPQQDTEVRGRSAKVLARIQVPSGRKLLRTKVYANGVVATERSLVAEKETADGKQLTYQWNVPLPSDERSLIQLIVKTDGDVTATSEVVIRRVDPGTPRQPKIYILSLGINQYGDPQINPLTYSVSDARATLDVLRSKSSGLYVVDVASLLTDRQVTPENWRASLLAIKKELQGRAVPDDLLVIFLAGHGFTDNQSKEYYYAGYNFALAGLGRSNPDYTGCISRKNLRILEDVSCRKLVILDTCHSGAIQLPRSRDPKAAVRTLQEDVIFTMTATTSEQRAAESPNWQHGVFTKTLVEGLQGEADKPGHGDGDGIVTLNEIATYVQTIVPQRVEESQNPTIAPDELLPFTRLPLARVKPHK